MGNVLGILGTCLGGVPGVQIDFTTKPTDDEAEVHAQVQKVVEGAAAAQQVIQGYTGCQELARVAMSTPTKETELAAFEGLLLAVASIKHFHDYSHQIANVLPVLLLKLADGERTDPATLGLAQTPALTLQLCEIFAFCLSFDATRMLRPNLSNDFSYYRRLLPKHNKHPNIVVADDAASQMAIFTAQHIPMLNCLTKAAVACCESYPDKPIPRIFSVLANSCLHMLKNKTGSAENQLLYARGMVGSILLYDYCDMLGAYSRGSGIQVKAVVMLLKRDFPGEGGLLNALHYSSKNFDSAPDGVRALFE